jgi:hypothetical protein
MKTSILSVALVAGTLVLAVQCAASTPGPAPAATDEAVAGEASVETAPPHPDAEARQAPDSQRIQLHIGQSRSPDGTSARVKFVQVLEDSRCPEGLQCVWAGRARIELEVNDGRSSETVELSTGSEEEGTAKAGGLVIHFAQLDPHPEEGQTTEPSEYVATLDVEVEGG